VGLTNQLNPFQKRTSPILPPPPKVNSSVESPPTFFLVPAPHLRRNRFARASYAFGDLVPPHTPLLA